MDPVVRSAGFASSEPGPGSAARPGDGQEYHCGGGDGPGAPEGGAREFGGQEPSFQERVAKLSADPSIRNLARRYARNSDLAQDALQLTYEAVSAVRDPSHITDLRKYFCRVLQRKAVNLLESAGAAPSGDIEQVLAAQATGAKRLGNARSPVEDCAVRAAQVAQWQLRLTKEGDRRVPARSPQPERYRKVVSSVARWVLATLHDGELDAAELDRLLRHGYPEWFASPDAKIATFHQRLSRGRRDVFALLSCVIGRDELLT